MKRKRTITVTLTYEQAKQIRLLCNFGIGSLDDNGDYFSRREVDTARRGLEKFIKAEGYIPAMEAGRIGYQVLPDANGRKFSEQ